MLKYSLKHPGRFVTDLLPSVFMILSGLLFYLYFHAHYLKFTSESWVEIDGVIHYDESLDRMGYGYKSYKYTISANDYSTNTIIFGDYFNRTPSEEWNSFQRRMVGDRIRVFVDPYTPHRSIIYRDVTDKLNSTLILGVLFMIPSFLIFSYRSKMIPHILKKWDR